ncbi:hypothetical protein D3C74_83560 [compost metagenome]
MDMNVNYTKTKRELEPRFYFTTDYDLVKHLSKNKIKYIDKGTNESTGEKYWKYILTNKLSSIAIPWKAEKDAEKYSLSRWEM